MKWIDLLIALLALTILCLTFPNISSGRGHNNHHEIFLAGSILTSAAWLFCIRAFLSFRGK